MRSVSWCCSFFPLLLFCCSVFGWFGQSMCSYRGCAITWVRNNAAKTTILYAAHASARWKHRERNKSSLLSLSLSCFLPYTSFLLLFLLRLPFCRAFSVYETLSAHRKEWRWFSHFFLWLAFFFSFGFYFLTFDLRSIRYLIWIHYFDIGLFHSLISCMAGVCPWKYIQTHKTNEQTKLFSN